MKKIITIVIIIAFLAWLLFPKKEVVEIKQPKPIITEIQQGPQSTKDHLSIDEMIRNNKASIEAKLAKEEIEQKSKEPELDLITAFRDYKYFELCQYVFELDKNKIDMSPIGQFNQFYSPDQRIRLEPSSEQLMYLKIHFDRCKSLYDKDAKFYAQASSQLLRRYSRIQAKSAQEKQLKQAIDLDDHFNETSNQLIQARKGAPKDISLKSEYFKQKREITQQINRLRSHGQSNFSLNIVIAGEERNQEINRLEQQLQQIENLEAENYFIDNELIIKLESQKQQLSKDIEGFLSQNTSPDAFLLLTNVFISDKQETQEDSNFIKKIKKSFNFYDSTNFKLLNKIVYPLVACSLNYPCNDESSLVLNICLDYKNNDSSMACGKNLEDFYLNNYLSPNQALDLNNYFNYLMDHYVKK
jgi:hypothetical protein